MSGDRGPPQAPRHVGREDSIARSGAPEVSGEDVCQGAIPSFGVAQGGREPLPVRVAASRELPATLRALKV